jgi:histone deacetylase 1/2
MQGFSFSCNKTESHSCEACHLGKHVHLPFSSSSTVASSPFQLLHSDVWTSPIPSNSVFTYYLVILDDYSHFVWNFPLRRKSDVPATLTSFFSYVCTQFGRPIHALQSDNGKEFDNLTVRTLLATHGTVFRLTCPYTSQQNGRAERILRTLNDCVCTLLFRAYMPPCFWPDALATATLLINIRPCRSRWQYTPHHLLFGMPPSYTDLCIIGCRCYPSTTATAAHKLALLLSSVRIPWISG